MSNYQEILIKLRKEEELLHFSQFTNETALEIGLNIIEKAKSTNKDIAINITKNHQEIFHYSFPNTSPDNIEWIKRKNNVVYHFHKSSLHVGTILKQANKSIEEKYNLSPYKYAPYGGSFPIIIKGVGVIGTIAISGLRQVEDHDLVISSIKEYLNL